MEGGIATEYVFEATISEEEMIFSGQTIQLVSHA